MLWWEFETLRTVALLLICEDDFSALWRLAPMLYRLIASSTEPLGGAITYEGKGGVDLLLNGLKLLVWPTATARFILLSAAY